MVGIDNSEVLLRALQQIAVNNTVELPECMLAIVTKRPKSRQHHPVVIVGWSAEAALFGMEIQKSEFVFPFTIHSTSVFVLVFHLSVMFFNVSTM